MYHKAYEKHLQLDGVARLVDDPPNTDFTTDNDSHPISDITVTLVNLIFLVV